MRFTIKKISEKAKNHIEYKVNSIYSNHIIVCCMFAYILRKPARGVFRAVIARREIFAFNIHGFQRVAGLAEFFGEPGGKSRVDLVAPVPV